MAQARRLRPLQTPAITAHIPRMCSAGKHHQRQRVTHYPRTQSIKQFERGANSHEHTARTNEYVPLATRGMKDLDGRVQGDELGIKIVNWELTFNTTHLLLLSLTVRSYTLCAVS